MTEFDPWVGYAKATRANGRVTATCVISADSGYLIESAEVVDGVFLTLVFREVDE